MVKMLKISVLVIALLAGGIFTLKWLMHQKYNGQKVATTEYKEKKDARDKEEGRETFSAPKQEKVKPHNKIKKQERIDQRQAQKPSFEKNRDSKEQKFKKALKNNTKKDLRHENSDEREKALSKMMKKQIDHIYGELFDELRLPPEQEKKLSSHLVRSNKLEAGFTKKLMDETIPVEEILKEQERLSQELDQDLGTILSKREQKLTREYRDSWQKNMQKKQLNGLLRGIATNEAEKEQTRYAIDRAVEKMSSPKRMGEYNEEDILKLRAKFGQGQNSKEFLIKDSEERMQELLDNLDELPPQQYAKLKEKLDHRLKMMRRMMKKNS